jgi:tetratricopeptide (TPR) repeat protein
MTKDKDEIISNIRRGLTGDDTHDARYLYEAAEAYKDHPEGGEIAAACGTMLMDMIPEDRRADLDRMFRRQQGIDEAIVRAQQEIKRGMLHKAEQILFEAVKSAGRARMYTDNTKEEYRSFTEPYEQILYVYRTQTKRRIKNADNALLRLYFLYGSVLLEEGKMGASRASFKKARNLNPVSTPAALRIAESYRMEGKLMKMAAAAKEAHKNAYKAADVAAAMRYFAYFFSEKEKWQEALTYLLLSLTFDKDNQEAKEEIAYVRRSAREGGLVLQEPSEEVIAQIEETTGFPVHPDLDVVGIAWNAGTENYSRGDFEKAEYFLTIVYDLTGDQESLHMLKKIRGQ